MTEGGRRPRPRTSGPPGCRWPGSPWGAGASVFLCFCVVSETRGAALRRRPVLVPRTCARADAGEPPPAGLRAGAGGGGGGVRQEVARTECQGPASGQTDPAGRWPKAASGSDPPGAGAGRQIRTAGFLLSLGTLAGQDGQRRWAWEGEALEPTWVWPRRACPPRRGLAGGPDLAGPRAPTRPPPCHLPRCRRLRWGGIALRSRATHQGSERCWCPGSQVAALRKSSPHLVVPEPGEGPFPPDREEPGTHWVTKVTGNPRPKSQGTLHFERTIQKEEARKRV